MASRSRSSSLSSFDDEYFYRTYVPLSNLPTPPPSSRSEPVSPSSLIIPDHDLLNPSLHGPAIHLTNLIPSSACLTYASIPHVQALLTRANLPLETLALAVCILDSLNSRFSHSYRQSLPLLPAQHIDTVSPDLLILCALILAEKFIDDRSESTAWYCQHWALEAWTCAQINVAQRIMMENVGYRLLPMWTEKIISRAMRDMELAGVQERETWATKMSNSGGAVKSVKKPLPPTAPRLVSDYGSERVDENARNASSRKSTSSGGHRPRQNQPSKKVAKNTRQALPLEGLVTRGRFGF